MLIILSVTFRKCLSPLDCVPLTVVFCQFGSVQSEWAQVSKGWGQGRLGQRLRLMLSTRGPQTLPVVWGASVLCLQLV